MTHPAPPAKPPPISPLVGTAGGASNAFLGYGLGWVMTMGWAASFDYDWTRGMAVCLLGVLLHFAMVLASAWLARVRQAGATPGPASHARTSSHSNALTLSILLALSAIALAFFLHLACGIAALLVVMLMAASVFFGSNTAGGAVATGLWRAGLYFVGHAAWWKEFYFDPRLIGPAHPNLIEIISGYLRPFVFPAIMAAGLFCHVLGVSLAGLRNDAHPKPALDILIKLLLVVPLLVTVGHFLQFDPLTSFAATVPCTAWIIVCWKKFERWNDAYGTALLAGIPLVDLAIAIPLAFYVRTRVTGIPHAPLIPMLAIPFAAFLLDRALLSSRLKLGRNAGNPAVVP